MTLDQRERAVREPALCEQLPVRDYLDDVVVRTNGSLPDYDERPHLLFRHR
jgi:hypothetical protein